MIIDMSSSLPTDDFFLAEIRMGRGSRYVKVFGRGLARWVGMDEEEIERLVAGDNDPFVDRILELAERNGRNTVEAFVAELDAGGVDYSVLHNFHEPPTPTAPPRVDNEKVAEICRRYPNRFLGFAGVSPHDGPAAVGEVDRAVCELGLVGVAIRPFRQKLRANDAAYYPIYQRCLELGVPVWLHTSNNFFSDVSLDFARPIYLDQVACDFQELTLIAGHGGWPYMDEMVAVAWRHPNVYIDVSAFRPKYLARPGSGWEPLLHYGNSVLQDQIVVGTDWLEFGVPPRQLFDEIRALPLRDHVKEKWLGGNARRIFRL